MSLPRPPGRAALLLAVFAASFLAVAAIVRAAIGWPDVSGVRKKADFVAADPDGFDVLFVGSSNVMNSIQPELFDAVLRERGYDLRSYNLGLPGMLAFETDYMVERMLAGRSDRLRWVFVELTDWRPSPRLSDESARGVYWHTPERVAAMADAALHYDGMTDREKLAFVREHVELMLWWLASFGRAQEELSIELGVRAEDNWNPRIDPAREGGYVALEESGNEGAMHGRELFLADERKYIRAVLEMRRRAPAAGPPEEYLARSARRRLAFFDGTGVEPIHLLLATTTPTEDLERLGPPAGPLPELWAFNRPAEYPALYDLPNRFDDRHLQRSGAEVLTRLLAERFADHLDAANDR